VGAVFCGFKLIDKTIIHLKLIISKKAMNPLVQVKHFNNIGSVQGSLATRLEVFRRFLLAKNQNLESLKNEFSLSTSNATYYLDFCGTNGLYTLWRFRCHANKSHNPFIENINDISTFYFAVFLKDNMTSSLNNVGKGLQYFLFVMTAKGINSKYFKGVLP